MIVPMSKLSLLIFYKDYRPFLGELREKGVVHIHENKTRSAQDDQLRQKLNLVKRTGDMLKLLARRIQVDGKMEPGVPDEELLEHLEGKYKRLEQIKQQIAACQKEYSMYEPWGEYSPARIDGLRDAGWDMRFFTVPRKKFLPDWEEKYSAFEISENAGQKYFVTVNPIGEEALPEADDFIFPESSMEQLLEKTRQLEEESNRIADYLDQIVIPATERLKVYRCHLHEDTDELKINKASVSIMDEKVIALEGWVPADIKEDTDRWLEDKGVYYEFQKPTIEDNPPIKLKNNKFAKLFEFIGELYSLPNYGEIDLTPFFAPFFVLFFGFCLGDAGYGLLLLVGVSLYKLKAKPEIKPILSLAQWLGGATVVMGLVSGTFFGIPLLEVQIPWLQRFKAYMLDSQQLFNLSLMIGGLQIVFGMFIKMANQIKRFGITYSLATMGWLVLILGEGTCFLLSKRGLDVTIAMYVVGIVAGLMILVFNHPKRNVFVNIGAGLWDTYNMATGLLGDLLSYIRLFALGISSSVLGLVFNDLAMNMSGDIPVVSQILMVIILLLGHSMNIFMAGLGSFVHPMRLTFVEFYKNAGFDGGGKKYLPFRRRTF